MTVTRTRTRAPRTRTRTAAALDLRRFPLVGAVAVAVLLFLYVPMAVVVAYAFNSGEQALVWEGFSTRWFAEVVQDPRIVDATVNSLKVATAAMVVSVVVSVAILLVLDRYGRAGRAWALGLIAAPLVIPEIVLGVATLSFIRIVGLGPGFTALVLAHTTFCIPFALLPMRSRYAGLAPAYFEAAADLGATGFRLFRRVTLPLLTPGIVSGALLAFIISLDDVIISNFLTSAGTTTLPIYLFSLIRKGVSPAVDAVATLLLLLAVLVVAASTLLTQRKRES